MTIRSYTFIALGLSLTLSFSSLADEIEAPRTLHLTATAYNSVPEQTNSEPNIAAWGDDLVPGVRAIAVSRDLLEMGLTRGAEVKIDGLPGTFTVLDKMGRRWEKRIDIYMGEDIEAAREWGVRKVKVLY